MKNKLMKRITCVAMSLMLLSTLLLAGCGSGNGQNDTGTDSGQGTKEETADVVEPSDTGTDTSEETATSEGSGNEFVDTYLSGKGLKEDGTPYKIGLIHANLESEYVIYLSQYAKFLFEQAGCEVTLCQSEMNSEKEDGYIEDFIEKKVDCVIIDAIDSNGSSASVKKLTSAGIPVVCTIRTVEGVDYELFVSTSDNVKTGEKCMQYLAEQTAGKDVDIVSVQGYMGASDAYNREEGFQNVLTANTNISYTPNDCEWASVNAEAAITDALTANPNLWGVASHSAAMTAGVYSALQQAGKAAKVGEEGHIFWASIDGAAADLDMVRNGYLDATVDQSPLTNATTCVRGVLDYILKGEALGGKQVDVETTLITSDNVNDAGWWGDYDIEDAGKGILWDGTEEAWNSAEF